MFSPTQLANGPMVDSEMDHVLSLRRIAHEIFTGLHPINDPLSKVTMENPLEMEY